MRDLNDDEAKLHAALMAFHDSLNGTMRNVDEAIHCAVEMRLSIDRLGRRDAVVLMSAMLSGILEREDKCSN